MLRSKPVNRGRHRAEIDGEVVVFLIGMRFNTLRGLRRGLWVFAAIPRMLRHLEADPAAGLLAHRLAAESPRAPTVVQYWRSFEHLERFARDAQAPHLEPWRRFNSRFTGSGDVGIWHETYRLTPGALESVYVDMPVAGLAAAGRLAPVGSTSRARERIHDGASTQP